MRTRYPLLIIVAVIVLSPGVFPVRGFSQAVFYQGKTLKIINNDPGGVVSLRVKTVTRYLTKYIPGNPTIFVEIMEGGPSRCRHVNNGDPANTNGGIAGRQELETADSQNLYYLKTKLAYRDNISTGGLDENAFSCTDAGFIGLHAGRA